MTGTHCPRCGAPMVTRTSRPLDRWIERRRVCRAKCGHADVVLVEPEKIIRVMLCTQTPPLDATAGHGVESK
ncbi:MAG: ogr/Delta-like zinc finger family protein [Pirellulales bacterium]|nr:ogr/Delta-like zinc finger family protein [Pirellulales bacterium]